MAIKFHNAQRFVSHFFTFESEDGLEWDLFIHEKNSKWGPTYEAYFCLHENGYLAYLLGGLQSSGSLEEFISFCKNEFEYGSCFKLYLDEFELIENFDPKECDYEV